MAVAGVDTLVSVSMLIVLFFVFTFAPAATVYWVPFLVLVLLVFTCGVVLALSSLTVYVRDLRQALPILLQLGLFATPVAYGLDGIPAWARPTYVIINPLAVVIEGLRRCVLYNRAPPLHLLELATMSSVVYLAIGVYVFKKLEGGIADVA
jgi:ABC-2 type transport system permease protein/lipopolysaccharide transport system permease protein